jgi:fermentation-respiration switch protein FrsA (DUF1100 family)
MLAATPADIGLPFETVRLTTTDGIRLHGWFIPAVTPRGTLLFSHGNAGNVSHRLDSVRLFHSLNLNVLIYDYRGYGESEGKPSEEGTYRDVQAAWNYLRGHCSMAPEAIIIFGRSLGAAVAADLASQVSAAGVILESAFTSIPDMAASLYPWMPVRLLVRFHYDNLAKIRRITSPLLVAHSREDEIIPYAQGVRLFAQASEPKQFLELHGGHSDGYQVSRKLYTTTMRQFLDDILPPAGETAACTSSR